MKSFIFSLFILLTLSYSIPAQNLNIDYSSAKSTIRLSEYKDQWKVAVQPMEMIHPGGNSYQNFLFEEKNKVSLLYPRKKTSSVKRSNSNKPTFIIENSFVVHFFIVRSAYYYFFKCIYFDESRNFINYFFIENISIQTCILFGYKCYFNCFLR